MQGQDLIKPLKSWNSQSTNENLRHHIARFFKRSFFKNNIF